MKPVRLPLHARPRPVCQLCDYILQQPVTRRAFLSAASLKAPSIRPQPVRSQVAVPRIITRRIAAASKSLNHLSADSQDASSSERIAALQKKLAEVEAHIRGIYSSQKVEHENVILKAFDGLEQVAREAIAIRSRQPLPTKTTIRHSSAGAILSGLGGNEDVVSVQKKVKQKSLGFDALPSPGYLSKRAEELIRHETVFISPDVLQLYIHLQRLLARPQTIPEALYLYANKPVPLAGSSPPKFEKASPKSARQVIPADLAHEALTAAVEAKDMPLALSVIDHTYCAPAWRRHRMFTKLGLPTTLAAMTPFMIYMLAQEASVYSGFIDPFTFKLYTFFGISTYVACVGTLGFVALTTYNDHHDRVVWRPGVPLLDRYMREDERAALDRIAVAWGFKELWRRGDEEGEEWEGLRQWILLRGMVLDKPDLMPGMNPQSHTQEQ